MRENTIYNLSIEKKITLLGFLTKRDFRKLVLVVYCEFKILASTLAQSHALKNLIFKNHT